MLLYHGSPKQGLPILLPAAKTGCIRKGEEGRRGFRDVVFATTDFNEALRYAQGGSVYVLDSKDTRQYRPLAEQVLSPKKAKSVGENIYILPVGRVIAEYRCAPRRRGEKQRYCYDVRVSKVPPTKTDGIS